MLYAQGVRDLFVYGNLAQRLLPIFEEMAEFDRREKGGEAMSLADEDALADWHRGTKERLVRYTSIADRAPVVYWDRKLAEWVVARYVDEIQRDAAQFHSPVGITIETQFWAFAPPVDMRQRPDDCAYLKLPVTGEGPMKIGSLFLAADKSCGRVNSVLDVFVDDPLKEMREPDVKPNVMLRRNRVLPAFLAQDSQAASVAAMVWYLGEFGPPPIDNVTVMRPPHEG